MFAVDGWKLPNVVPQKAEKKRKEAPCDTTRKAKKKVKVQSTVESTKIPKDKSKYLPYSKDKGRTGPNSVPVRERSASTKRSDEETGTRRSDGNPSANRFDATNQADGKRSRQSDKKTNTKQPHDMKKPLARPPRSERETTPPKLISAEPPASFTGLFAQKNLTRLQQKMAAKLSGARFRWINEKLYTTTGSHALALISESPDMFEEYHAGFRAQVADWPANPVDQFKSRLYDMMDQRKKAVVADLGCGEAMLAASMLQRDPASKIIQVESYDLKAANERIVACDIAHLPRADASIDVAIFCLSLMGTDFLRFIQEAHRVLKGDGLLWIAEIKSRFNDVDAKSFIDQLAKMGFTLSAKDESNKMFIHLDFVKKKKAKKEEQVMETPKKIGVLLKPCTYKKR